MTKVRKSCYFIKSNEGHLIIVPVKHYENLYELPDHIAAKILQTAKTMAICMKRAYKCDGVTQIQNNEPASDQHAFHYHLHLFPRYNNDNFYQIILEKRETSPKERKQFADKIKHQLKSFS